MQTFEIARHNDPTYKPPAPWTVWDYEAPCWVCRSCGAASGYQRHNSLCAEVTSTPNDETIALAAEAAKDADIQRLVAEMHALPTYNGWEFDYMYPGYFRYYHTDSDRDVFFTPDWECIDAIAIQVQDDEGTCYEEFAAEFPLPREGRSGQQIFELVRPTLDKLMEPAAPSPRFDVHVQLTTTEIDALFASVEHVRMHMAHQQPWAVRDAAMKALGKVLEAARLARGEEDA